MSTVKVGDVAQAASLRSTKAPVKHSGLQHPAAHLTLTVVTFVFALLSALVIFLMLAFLAAYAWPAIVYNGTNFFTSLTWNIGDQYGSGAATVHHGYSAEPGASFGAFVFIAGTLLTSVLCMLVAVPLSILVALALVYRIPGSIKPIANALVELMAGVPSVVYGLWGLVVLVPFISQKFGPFVSEHLGFIPGLGGSVGSGNGLLASVLILVLMVVPIMVATTRDVMQALPSTIFEASMALGGTSWQAVTRAVLPAVRTGVVASILLAFGRALGETMAVLMVCGAALNTLPQNVFQPVNTVAAVIVSQLESALTDSTGMAQRSLAELAVTLFIITLSVNIVARTIMRGVDRKGATPG